MNNLVSFNGWKDVIAHVHAGRAVWYQAPMDQHARLVRTSVHGPKARTVKVMATPYQWQRGKPPFAAFTADVGHLDRFRYQGGT